MSDCIRGLIDVGSVLYNTIITENVFKEKLFFITTRAREMSDIND